MRTNELIRVIAADTTPERPVGAGLAAALFAGGAVALAALFGAIGIRPDLAAALLGLRVAARETWLVWLALAAGGAALRLAIPSGRPGPWLAVIAAVPAFLAVAVAVEMRVVPAADWHRAMMGSSAAACLGFVALLALPILPGVLWALRRGASPRPTLSGALAGLLSGSTAAAIYSLHCTEDSPLFYAVWYVLGILAVTAVGAAFGRQLLRW